MTIRMNTTSEIDMKSSDAPAPRANESGTLVRPVLDVLRELQGVLGALSAAQYSAPMGPVFADASIGGHVRHCLDHIRAIFDGQATGTVDYDHRERGTDIEVNKNAATAEVLRLIGVGIELQRTDADEPLSVVIMPTRNGASVTVRSTLGRELAFVLSHTIHHNALIRAMIVTIGLQAPKSFGYAPSTLAHQDGHACAH